MRQFQMVVATGRVDLVIIGRYPEDIVLELCSHEITL
jgi:hypothetical protein